MLTLPEELILLALDADSGSISSCSARLPFALAGAVLAELLLAGHIRLDGEQVVAANGPPPGDEVLRDALALIRNEENRKKIKHWVDRFHSKLHIQERTLDALAARGIVHHEDRHFLLFHYDRYPMDQRQSRTELRERLRGSLLGPSVNEDRIACLIALAEPCNLVRRAFEPEEWKTVKDRAKQIAAQWPVSAAVVRAIEEMEAAIVASTVAMSG